MDSRHMALKLMVISACCLLSACAATDRAYDPCYDASRVLPQATVSWIAPVNAPRCVIGTR